MAGKPIGGAPFTERLEVRLCLDASIARVSTNRSLLVFGDGSNNVIRVSVATDGVHVNRDGIDAVFDRSSFVRIFIDSDSGDDFIVNATKIKSTIVSGDGNDTAHGGRGNDWLLGNEGDDAIKGGAGDDTIEGGLGNDTMLGGDGADFADFKSSPTAFTFIVGSVGTDLNPPGFTGWLHAKSGSELDITTDEMATVGGTFKADRFALFDTHGATFLGYAGRDIFEETGDLATCEIFGGSGNDYVLVDGASFTHVFGGAGDDRAGEYSDSNSLELFDGGSGTDAIDMGLSDARILDLRWFTSVENAVNFQAHFAKELTIIGTDGPNLISADTAVGLVEEASVTLLGGGGGDTIIGTSNADSIDGGDGDDSIEAGAGNDKIHGGAGSETIVGNRGHDKIFGDDGDDVSFARDNTKDTLDGGADNDMADRDVIDDVRNIESFI